MTIDPLLVDLYEPDGDKDWRAFFAVGMPWIGAVLKLSEGTSYTSGIWFERNLGDLINNAGNRLGVSAFHAAYHYLRFDVDGARQAEFAHARYLRAAQYLYGRAMTVAELPGRLPLWLDVERGSQASTSLTKAIVERVSGAFALRWAALTGQVPMLYGGALLRDLDINDRMGCSHSIVAAYGPELHGARETTAQFLERTGTDLTHLFAWQYCGDGQAQLAGYPRSAPGCGKIDISVLTLPAGLIGVQQLSTRAIAQPVHRVP